MNLTRRAAIRRMALASAGLAAGCAKDSQSAAEFAGRLKDPPLAKPTTPLIDTTGAPFDIAARTDGRLTLLFFGYTSCPDVCPVQLGVLAGALKHLQGTPGARPEVLFVGVDLARDTPQVLRSYLDRYNSRFIGLTGTEQSLAAIEAELQLPPPVIEPPDSAGNYSVGHSSQILVYTPDNLCHIEYPFGVRQQDWIADLPRLATKTWPTEVTK